jgi:polyferredoxin
LTSTGIKTLRWARIISQALFFGIFIYIFVRSLDPFSPGENPFLRFDPLVFLTHLKAEIRFVLSMAGILVLTFIAGRYFCGWVCPMGSLVDLLDLAASPLRKVNPFKEWKAGFALRWAKHPPAWFILGATLPAIFFTPPVLQFFHPNVWIVRVFSLSALGLAFAALLVVLASFSRRFWCAYLCPLGALYGLIGKVSLFKFSIAKCSRCGRCALCPMDAALPAPRGTPGVRSGIRSDARFGDRSDEGYRIVRHQCILCFDYEERCPVEGFRYAAPFLDPGKVPSHPTSTPARAAALQGSTNQTVSPDMPTKSAAAPNNTVRGERARAESMSHATVFSRREFLRGGSVFLGGLALGSGLSAFDRTVETDLIRPPGVVDDTLFVKRCLRCFQCVRSCPNKIIKITGLGSGFDSLFTPHIEYNEYGCDYTCQVCQQVCPNYAIPLQPLPEKQKTKMGLAAIDERLCVVFARDTNCLVCEEFCPIPNKAIKVVEKTKAVHGKPIVLRYPVVDVSLCNGCGKCEGNCPVIEDATRAIRVSRVRKT